MHAKLDKEKEIIREAEWGSLDGELSRELGAQDVLVLVVVVVGCP